MVYSGCYGHQARTLYKQAEWTNEYHDGDCSGLSAVQLSNSILLPPDSTVFEETGLMGWGWVDTPFGNTSDADTRRHWTLVVDTKTFKGPVFYVLPEFFTERDGLFDSPPDSCKCGSAEDPGDCGCQCPPDYTRIPSEVTDLQNCTALHHGDVAMEVQGVPMFKSQTHPTVKLPKISFPRNGDDGDVIVAMGSKSYRNADVKYVLDAALKAGSLNAGMLMANGRPLQVEERNFTANFAVENSEGDATNPNGKYAMGQSIVKMKEGEGVWSLRFDERDCGDKECTLPQYLSCDWTVLDSDGMPSCPTYNVKWVRTPGDEVPQDLVDSHFPEQAQKPLPYIRGDAGTATGKCFDKPVSPTIYCRKMKDNTTMAWQWYKYIDQPALQRLALSEKQRSDMQARVESLHKMLGLPKGDGTLPESWKWMKSNNAEQIGLATLDPAVLMKPPSGLEVGFVPIAVYQGLQSPNGLVIGHAAAECNWD